MRFRYAGIGAAVCLVVAACSGGETAGPSGPSFSSVNAAAKTWVIVASGATLPSDLANRVTAAGGTVTAAMTEIGVMVATSDDANFAGRVGRLPGVGAVAEDVTLEFAQPRVADDVLEVEESGITASAVGATESFRMVQWAPDAISAPAAWETGALGAGARVAILDGGLRDTHIDIAPNLDVAHSASFVPGQPFNADVGTFWHGTHVAGIVAASANGLGTVGIAPEATIIGVKVLHSGSGAFSWIMQGIYYAATPIAEGGAGADIINMSLGAVFPSQGPNAAALLNALSRATSYARQRGVLVVVATGNDGIDFDHTANLVSVPAMSVGVTAVSATGPLGWALGATDVDRPASYTNYGQSLVTLAGPGGDFALPGNALCSVPRLPSGSVTTACWVFDMVMAPCRGSGASNGTYCWAAGTSMATPAVAGVAALVIGKYGHMPPAQLEAILRQSADDLGKPGNDDFYGRGRVNALRAVQ